MYLLKFWLLLYIHFFVFYSVFSQVNHELVGIPCFDEYSKSSGECIYLRNCENAKKLYETQRIKPTICGYTNAHTVVCCVKENPKWKSVSERKCDQYISQVSTKITVITLDSGESEELDIGVECKIKTSPLIVGGENANPGEFPHMAAIGWLTFKNTYLFNCGGTLISDRYVLTAAHCTFWQGAEIREPSIVRIGDHDLNSNEDNSSPLDINIANMFLHPNYTSKSQYNDIALLYLANTVRFNNFIRPACLWQEPLENNRIIVATGWGVTDSGSISSVLQKVSVNVISNERCRKIPDYQKLRRMPNGIIDTQLCAGTQDGGKDTCQGDSGGPIQLTMTNPCIYYVAGITSVGKICGAKNSPGIYTKVHKYIPWIEKVVWPNE